MRHDQSVQDPIENPGVRQKKETPKQASPDDGGGQMQFKILVMALGVGVLVLILKSLGVL